MLGAGCDANAHCAANDRAGAQRVDHAHVRALGIELHIRHLLHGVPLLQRSAPRDIRTCRLQSAVRRQAMRGASHRAMMAQHTQRSTHGSQAGTPAGIVMVYLLGGHGQLALANMRCSRDRSTRRACMPVVTGRGRKAVVSAAPRELGYLVPATGVGHILPRAREIQETVARMVRLKVPMYWVSGRKLLCALQAICRVSLAPLLIPLNSEWLASRDGRHLRGAVREAMAPVRINIVTGTTPACQSRPIQRKRLHGTLQCKYKKSVSATTYSG
jgi:hypothetical protein